MANTNVPSNEVLTAALDYAAHGWSVLPIWWVDGGKCGCGDTDENHKGGKHPIGALVPQGLNNATKDPDVIRQWVENYPRMNLAVATGAVSNIVVLDLDMRDVGEDVIDGEFELQAWLAARGVEMPTTLTASTGGGGKHLIMSLPDSPVRPVITSRANWLPGVDIRGDGGYIVVAPSQHESGVFYKWDSKVAMATISQELTSALSTRQRTSAATGKPMPSLGAGESIDVQHLLANGLPRGGRDDGFVRLVGVLRARGDSIEDARSIVQAVWAKTEQPAGDVYALDTALEKVERGYRNWEAPEPVGEIEMAWAISASARAGRLHAQTGGILTSSLSASSPVPGDPYRIGEKVAETSPQVPLVGNVDTSPNDEDDEDDEEYEEDRDPVEELNISELMLGGDIERDPPTMFVRTDGRSLVYPGRLHSIYGEPGHGKTWVALHLVKERLDAGESIVYFDYDEDDGGKSMAMRMMALGATPESVRNLHYFNPQGIGTDREQWGKIRKMIKRVKPSIVFVDTMAPAIVELGLNESDNTEVGAWYRHARWVISGVKTRPAMMIVDHMNKNNDGGSRWARGAGDKLGRLHVAYVVESTTPFSRETPGRINLVIAKDRGGEVGRQGDAAATVKFTPSNGGQSLLIEVVPPEQASMQELVQAHNNVVNEGKRRILGLINAEPSRINWKASEIKNAIRMETAAVNEALDALVEAGDLEHEMIGRTANYRRILPQG